MTFLFQMAVNTIDTWNPQSFDASGSNDPLVEQINIIKGYVKQARDALRFEEVHLLRRIYHFIAFSTILICF